MESRTFCIGLEQELSASAVIDEDSLGTSLADYVTNLFVEELKGILPESVEEYTYDYVRKYIGYVQFYVTRNSIVFYFNQGEGIESANQLYISSFYVDENNKITLVSEDDATYLLDNIK